MADDKNRNMNRDQDANKQGGQGNPSGQQGNRPGNQDRNMQGRDISGSQGSTDQNKKKNNW